MSFPKRDLIPVDELMELLRAGKSAAVATRILREKTGHQFSTATVRAVALDQGWVFTGRGHTPRAEITNLPELARRREGGESLEALAAEVGVCRTTLSKYLEEEGLFKPAHQEEVAPELTQEQWQRWVDEPDARLGCPARGCDENAQAHWNGVDDMLTLIPCGHVVFFPEHSPPWPSPQTHARRPERAMMRCGCCGVGFVDLPPAAGVPYRCSDCRAHCTRMNRCRGLEA